MITLLTTVFIASLIGSLHCAGMCGGIVALCVDGREVNRRGSMLPQVTYNLGRLITYAALGAVSGSIGAAVDLGGSHYGFARIAAIVAGAAMILIAVGTLLRSRGVKLGCVRLPAPVQKLLSKAMNHARQRPPVTRSFIIGLLTGLLPCGWLYAFVIASAGTGSAPLGALTMIAFWAGTVPIMLIVGVGLQKFTSPLRRHVPMLSSIALLIAGAVAITGRLSAPAYADVIKQDVNPQSCETAAHTIAELNSSELPCCHGGD